MQLLVGMSAALVVKYCRSRRWFGSVVCVRVRVCTYICVCVHECICAHLYVCACISAYVHTCKNG